MNYIGEYLLRSSNYKVMNKNNIYNTYIDILSSDISEQSKIFIIDSIKKNVGLDFYVDFKGYVFRKFAKSKLLDYMD